MKNNSTTVIIITIREKNTLVIADMIRYEYFKKKWKEKSYSLLKFPSKTSVNFQKMNFSPSNLYSWPGNLQMDRGTA